MKRDDASVGNPLMHITFDLSTSICRAASDSVRRVVYQWRLPVEQAVNGAVSNGVALAVSREVAKRRKR